MKSLETVVEKIEHEKEILNELKRCHVNNGFIEEEEKIIEKYQKIKADLEVLEIIRKYMKLASGVSYSGDFSEGVEYNLVHFEDIDDMVAKEDFNKVKQWLEENKDAI